MKKIISLFLIATLLLLSLQIIAFGNEQCNQEIQNAEKTIVETAEGLNNTENNTKSSDLFWTKSLLLAKNNSNQLLITASTECQKGVTKCGFTYIKLQRLIGGEWTDYTEYCYYNIYTNSLSTGFTKCISAPRGYTYRVTCEHYAEKALLGILKSKQKSVNTTTSIVL